MLLFPSHNAVCSQFTLGKSFQSWLIGNGKGPDCPLLAGELESEYETMRLFWLINQRAENSVLLTLNNWLHCSFSAMQRCQLQKSTAQTGGFRH